MRFVEEGGEDGVHLRRCEDLDFVIRAILAVDGGATACCAVFLKGWSGLR